MTMQSVRQGAGKPLLLVHGLGNTEAAWTPILPMLTTTREVVSVRLPGHGGAPAEGDSGTFEGLANSLDAFLDAEDLVGVDMVGSSLGGRLVLEMARRGNAGGVVSLDPGGFWRGWERAYVRASLTASVALVRALAPTLPAVAGTAAGRTALLLQLSARPWALDGALVAGELRAMAATTTAGPLIEDLTAGPEQKGTHADAPIVIGWGRHDRLLFPTQAARAAAAFPGARVHWFERSGHFPAWDEPAETAALILRTLN